MYGQVSVHFKEWLICLFCFCFLKAIKINYLLTESKVFTGKSQISALPYWPRYRSVIAARSLIKFFRKDLILG